MGWGGGGEFFVVVVVLLYLFDSFEVLVCFFHIDRCIKSSS